VHTVTEPGTTGHNQIGSQLAHRRLVGRGGVGDYSDTPGFGELDDVAADGAHCAGHREPGARVQIEGIDRKQGGQAIHRQRRCLDVACPLRCRRDLICLQNNIFGVSATRGVDRHDHRHRPVTHLQIGRGVWTDFMHDPRRVHTGPIGRIEVAGKCGIDVTHSHQRVCRVHRRGVHTKPNPARPGVGVGHIDYTQHVGAAVIKYGYSLH
jgi:hypothetical protein